MKYLLYIGPGIGDFALALPMARRIKLNDKNAYIAAFTVSSNDKFVVTKELLKLQKWIDEIGYYSLREPWQNMKLLWNFGYKNYDYGIKISVVNSKYASKWPNRIMKVAAKKILGMNLSNRPELKYDYSVEFSGARDVRSQTLDMLTKIGIKIVDEEIKYSLFDTNTFPLDTRLSALFLKKNKVIIMLPGCMEIPVTADGKNGSKQAKKWDYGYWYKLGKRLSDNGYCAVLLGGRKEKSEITFLSEKPDERIVSLCGETSLSESIALLQHADLVIGAETGMMHCAIAVGTPTLMLLGPTSGKKFSSWSSQSFFIQSKELCSPCFGTDRLIDCNDFKCMRSITVEMVYQKVLEILDGVQAKKYENKTDL